MEMPMRRCRVSMVTGDDLANGSEECAEAAQVVEEADEVGGEGGVVDTEGEGGDHCNGER